MSLTMRQLPSIIVLVILVLTSGLWIGCTQSYEPTTPLKEDNPNWSEVQVIDYLYNYLANKAEQVGGPHAEIIGKIRMDNKFREAIRDAELETIQEATRWPPSERVNLEFSVPYTVYADSLKRLAVYTGDSSWMITMGDMQWLINERTGEVKAENEAAKQVLGDISRNSYYDAIYNYAFAYPAGWKSVKLGNDDVAFFDPESPELTVINIAAKVYKLKPEETLGEYASNIASLTGLGGLLVEDYQLDSLISLENGDYQVDYEYEEEGFK